MKQFLKKVSPQNGILLVILRFSGFALRVSDEITNSFALNGPYFLVD
jgi:hypothetical protein